MDLGPYEGIPGVTAPFVGLSRTRGGDFKGYFLDVDVDIPPIERPSTPRTKRKTPSKAPRIPRSDPPQLFSVGAGPPSAVFQDGVRMSYARDTFFKSNTLSTIEEVPIPMGDIVRKPPVYKYKHHSHTPAHRSRGHKRGRLLLAPHANPDAVPEGSFKDKVTDFTKETVIPGVKVGARVTKAGAKTGAILTKKHTVKAAKWTAPKLKAGAIITKDTSIKVGKIVAPKIEKGAKSFHKKVKVGIQSLKQKYRKPSESGYDEIELSDSRDYELDPIEEDNQDYELDKIEEETPVEIPDETAGLFDIPEFRPNPNQISRSFKTPFYDREVRRAEMYNELGEVMKRRELSRRSSFPSDDDYSMSESDDSPTYNQSALSSPEGYSLVYSIHSSAMHDVEKLKQEIQRLQKTLSEKEDLVLASRRIAADKEKRLKADLSEVTEKYTEMCNQKSSVEEELKDLQENSVKKEEYNKLFTQYTKTESLVFELQSKLVNCAATVPLEEYRMLQRELEESTDEVLQYKEIAEKKESELEAVMLSQVDRMQALRAEHTKALLEAKKMSGKELTDRDNKLQILKEQITSALDEKSVARQEQLKELSRELEHASQDNRALHKKIQEMTNRQQGCEGCSKLKLQLKAVQESKRMGELSVLKPIKEKSKTK